MGFYNVLQGDAPYFKSLADTYAMSDNFHQSIQGGTGANHVALGTGDRGLVQRRQGQPDDAAGARDREPRSAGRHEQLVHAGRLLGRHLQQLRRRDAAGRRPRRRLPALASTWTRTARRATTTSSTTTTRATSATAPSTRASSRSRRPRRARSATSSSSTTSRGATTATSGIATSPTPRGPTRSDNYCNICNPFQYATSIMTNDAFARRTSRTRSTSTATSRTAGSRRSRSSSRAVWSTVTRRRRSSTSSRASPRRSSTPSRRSPSLWKDTAIIITFDEGGGYYDSGYVQPLDFFGDGTRIPAIVVSPWATEAGTSRTSTPTTCRS